MASKELLHQVASRNNFPLPYEAQHLQVWSSLSSNAFLCCLISASCAAIVKTSILCLPGLPLATLLEVLFGPRYCSLGTPDFSFVTFDKRPGNECNDPPDIISGR
ncbi:MAG: hypothetical protein ABR958_04680 [Dehalococcoidales bacterium]